ncbi:hypothetical protein KRZ98_23885, partial [Sphingobium sp. AS12]|uniref:hypothetical protein n=1 Tax=Sphingobium sp. AS12 TaxID=2849495 RepID=UPI001C319408
LKQFCSVPDSSQPLNFTQGPTQLSIPVDWKFTHSFSQVEELTTSSFFKNNPMPPSSMKSSIQ